MGDGDIAALSRQIPWLIAPMLLSFCSEIPNKWVVSESLAVTLLTDATLVPTTSACTVDFDA